MNNLQYFGPAAAQRWTGPLETISFDEEGIKAKLRNLDAPCYAVRQGQNIGISNEGKLGEALQEGPQQLEALPFSPALPVHQFGDPAFKAFHNVNYAYYAGSMANGISSEALVIALGKAGFLASFGAGGLVPARIEQAIQKIQAALPQV